ncbi:Atrazine chlorohydrolase [Neomoorella glycerini]|uniref:5-methylthioadenosine/S-adenosylhomocysteine deaminase n=1 Tax=Neomoorella glycerini TaxID=55779 RepID=A0A6I5ZT15_9FIRM|nr:amidohydrolase [Moorella glycerini]QGP93114.1 Atrazine chlorohydrolase [Moorella glycerini]
MSAIPQKADLLLTGGYVLTMNERQERLVKGAVAIKGSRLVGVGEAEALKAQFVADKVIDCTGAIIMPGLVNAHTHETLTRGLAEDLPLMRWLQEICYPLEKNYTAADMQAAALMNQLEMIRGGITCFIDIFRFADAAAAVARESGLRAIFSPQIIDEFSSFGESLPRTERLIKEWHGCCDNRIQVWVGVHAPYSNSPAVYRQARELANRYGVGLHTHLAETRDEVRLIAEKYGKTPARHLFDLGVFDGPSVVAHCVHLSEEDMDILARQKVGIAYNPTSNIKMAAGIAPVPQMLAKGCRVGLGTDSNLSNNNLDMFEEMRWGSYIQKMAHNDAGILPAYRMLHLATMGSAAALGLDKEIGSLEVGKKADIIVLSLKAPHLWPVYTDRADNVVEQIVYSARADDVITTIVDGRLLMEDKKVLTIDEDRAFHQVQSAAASLYERSFGQ